VAGQVKAQPIGAAMGPRLAAFFLRGMCERLNRLELTLTLLHETLEAKKDEGLWPASALADLASDEAQNVCARYLHPVIKGLEANCEPDAAPEDGEPTA
jgi:hypothetical protein